MIRSPRRHEGPPKRPEQTSISTMSLALGQGEEDLQLDITCLWESLGCISLKSPMMSTIAKLQLPPRGLSQLLSISQQWWERLLLPGIQSSNKVNNMNYNSEHLRILNMLLAGQRAHTWSIARTHAHTHSRTHALMYHLYPRTLIWIPFHNSLGMAINWYLFCWVKACVLLLSRHFNSLFPLIRKRTNIMNLSWPWLANQVLKNLKKVSSMKQLTISNL